VCTNNQHISPVDQCQYEDDFRSQCRSIGTDDALAWVDTADVIYVNGGCTQPAESWLDRLSDGGRLILPPTSDRSFATKDQGFTAKSLAQIERAQSTRFNNRSLGSIF
jgi:protein-L-isoaspartate O-methyltransferase